jgi:hypothetical protein
MKKLLIFTAAGAALLAAGYRAGNARRSGEAEGRRGGAVSTVLAGHGAGESSAADGAAANEPDVKSFTPGRPFAKGQAKAWLLSLAPRLSGDRRGNAMVMVEMAQLFLTMDEASVTEVAAAVGELASLHEAGDESLKRIPDVDDMLQGAAMISMIRLSQINPESALTILQRTEGLDDEAMQFVFGNLAAKNPARAEELAGTLEKGPRREALEAILYSVANRDPADALEFAARYPEEIEDHHRNRVMESWAHREPRQASEAAVQASQRAGDPEILRNTLGEWWRHDGKAAEAWAANLQGAARVTAQAMFLEKRAGEEPDAVLQEYGALQQVSTNPKELLGLTSALAESLAERNLSQAREWAQNLPEGELRDRALSQVAERWVQDDAPAASEWIRTLPDGEMKDNVARTLCNAISRRDPASAFQWAQSIGQENVRFDALGRVVEHWREQDPDAAKAAVDSLPAALQERLR